MAESTPSFGGIFLPAWAPPGAINTLQQVLGQGQWGEGLSSTCQSSSLEPWEVFRLHY